MTTELIDLTDELRSALSAHAPVVALESTVIAHGLPRPQNLETARRLEQIVREGGSLPATIEWLETNGVTVAGYACDELPAFYSRNSRLQVDVRCDTPEEVVRIFTSQRELGLQSALLVTVPVPSEAEVEPSILNEVLDE